MSNKFKNLCDKPITWGGYLKLCAISLIASTITSLGIYAVGMYKTRKDLETFDFGKENQTDKT